MLFNISQNRSYHPIKCCWSAWNVVLGAVCMLLNQYLHHHCHPPLLQESASGLGIAFSLKSIGSKSRKNSKPAWTSTSTLFCGYRLRSQRTLHRYLSPWLKKLQCSGNRTSRNGTLLKRRGKNYCKADTKTRRKWEISTWKNQSFNVHCLLSQHFHSTSVPRVVVLWAVWRRGCCSPTSQSYYFMFLKTTLKIPFEHLKCP